MKIRALEHLEAALTEDLKWRKHEIVTWEQVAANARKHEQPALLRGGLALLYAHWEGYVKAACLLYLEYVSRKGLSLGDLRSELVAVAVRGRVQMLAEAKIPERHTELIELVRGEATVPANLPYESPTIRTFANLNFTTFASIMHSVGCDSSRHTLASFTIDNRLLRARNEIAHGRYEHVSLSDWQDIRDRVVPILDDLREQLIDAAVRETYRRTPPTFPSGRRS